MTIIVEKEYIPEKPDGWDENACWLCGGFKRVEFTWVDDNEEVHEGVYDPCPQCEI